MTTEQIQFIVDHQRFPGAKLPVEWVETHISWVLLTPDFAFKIKKPVQYSFLDFSTLEQRAFFCQEEVRLNRRLAPRMYLDVLPVSYAADGLLEIGIEARTPVDFAVWMKRMDDRRQMDRLLLQNAVSTAEMRSLAKILAHFHQSVIIPQTATLYKAGDNRTDFDDLFGLKNACVQLFGAEAAAILEAWRHQVGSFLDVHEPRLHDRAEAGFWVDGHGDLHGRNIFLLPEGPVVFDCIEFNPHFRKLDVLNELAFLGMELDAGGHHELEKAFMDAYLREWKCIKNREDEKLLRYFKAYRANVRLKVTLMEWQQHPAAATAKTAGGYWDLLTGYLADL
jgi:aminoglycoside phosphotransferase family enzyme